MEQVNTEKCRKETRALLGECAGFVQSAKKRKKRRPFGLKLWKIFIDKRALLV